MNRLRIALALITDHDGHWLIARRKDDAHMGGYWEFPGGKVKTGETAVQAAVREAHEEVGLVVQPVGELDAVEYAYDDRHVTLCPVVCRVVSGNPMPLQASALAWTSAANFDCYPFPPANGPLLKALRGYSCERP
jgi:mutator protein MutT